MAPQQGPHAAWAEEEKAFARELGRKVHVLGTGPAEHLMDDHEAGWSAFQIDAGRQGMRVFHLDRAGHVCYRTRDADGQPVTYRTGSDGVLETLRAGRDGETVTDRETPPAGWQGRVGTHDRPGRRIDPNDPIDIYMTHLKVPPNSVRYWQVRRGMMAQEDATLHGADQPEPKGFDRATTRFIRDFGRRFRYQTLHRSKPELSWLGRKFYGVGNLIRGNVIPSVPLAMLGLALAPQVLIGVGTAALGLRAYDAMFPRGSLLRKDHLALHPKGVHDQFSKAFARTGRVQSLRADDRKLSWLGRRIHGLVGWARRNPLLAGAGALIAGFGSPVAIAAGATVMGLMGLDRFAPEISPLRQGLFNRLTGAGQPSRLAASHESGFRGQVVQRGTRAPAPVEQAIARQATSPEGGVETGVEPLADGARLAVTAGTPRQRPGIVYHHVPATQKRAEPGPEKQATRTPSMTIALQ